MALFFRGYYSDDMFWKKEKARNPLDTRWLFVNELTESEKIVYDQTLKQIDNWWKKFTKNQSKISKVFEQGGKFDIAQFMDDNLHSIHPQIFWEFGPAINNKSHRLVLTPEDYKHLRSLVQEILNRAPKLDNWEFYGHRFSVGYESAKAIVKARTEGQVDDFKIQVEISEANEVNFYFIREEAHSETELNQALDDAFVALESMVGEENLDKWVGVIDVKNTYNDTLEIFNIKELAEVFEKKRHEIKYYLPEEFHYQFSNEAIWSGLELKPKEQDDYPYQNDLFFARTMNLPLWKNAHSGKLFYSERFSKFGEIFCYLKLDGTGILEEEKFEDKSAIENALDNVLIKEELGCVIGGGTGLKYSYIDLALVDIGKSIKQIKDVLRQGNITKNAWILFFDSELQNEWIGIWEETPKPYMIDFD